MGCLPCFNQDEDPVPLKIEHGSGRIDPSTISQYEPPPAAFAAKSNVRTFNFRELAMATKNFRKENLLGEGGFGRVFKGNLKSTDKVIIAVKLLDRTGLQENIEFVEEVVKLSHLHHPNLVNLIGYCADGSQRLLVYEFVSKGSLDTHLFDGDGKPPLEWNTRMKIACGIANGLQYLHEKANPPVMYRRLKPSNVLLDENFEVKLSDYGLAKLSSRGGGGDDNNQPSTATVMLTSGHCAPEQTRGEEITFRSDIYCFGIILLELITGRRIIDTTRSSDEQNLVTWAQPIFKEPKRFTELADPQLNNAFPVSGLNQAVGIAAMCLQEDPTVRPLVGDVVDALCVITMSPYNSSSSSASASAASFTPPTAQTMDRDNGDGDSSVVGSNTSCSDSNFNDGSTLSHHHASSESSIYQEASSGGDSEGSNSRRQQGSDSVCETSYQSDDGISSLNDDESKVEGSSTSVSSKGRSKTDSVESISSSSNSSETSEKSKSLRPKKSNRSSQVVTFREPSMNSRYSTSKKHIEEQEEQEQEQEPRAYSSSSSSDEEDSGGKPNNTNLTEYEKRPPSKKGSKSRSKKGAKSRKHRRGKVGTPSDKPIEREPSLTS